MAKLNKTDRQEWQALFKLAEDFYRVHIKPSEKFVDAFRNNNAHWQLEQDSNHVITDNNAWPYETFTANQVYAHFKSLEPKTILRSPKAKVRPAARVTGRLERLGARQDPEMRHTQAAVVQQIVNWRIREFDFHSQFKRAAFDDWARGFSVMRHGFTADTSRLSRGRNLEMEHHSHVRPGWPFMVHWPLEMYRFDSLARDMDERRWCAFGKFWRLDDLRADDRFSVPKTAKFTHLAGRDESIEGSADDKKFFQDAEAVLGRVLVWEVWDRRTRRIIHWVGGWGKEIGVEEWPVSFEGIDGLPDTIVMSNSANDIIPISEPSIYWELQVQLNKLVSMALVYVKRGVPLVGYQRSSVDNEEVENALDAEILEFIQTKGNPKDALSLMNLQPNLAGLLQAISVVRDLLREITAVGRFAQGSRENVESAAEANQIAQGQDIRVLDRSQNLQDGITAAVRKDWQIFQNSVSEDQIVDIVDFGEIPVLAELTPDAIREEYDLEIQVGSTQPITGDVEIRNHLAFMQASQISDEVRAQFNHRQMAVTTAQVFNKDETEVLAPRQAADAQVAADLQANAIAGEGTSNGSTNGTGAALDATKSSRDNATQ
ncbi:hypothetical protein [uncultured Mediterranean phage]|nr:hypothetical protein [uncultured Mediterranean phage]